MRSAWLVGMGAGLGGATLAALGNYYRGEPHSLSTMPDMVTGFAAILVIGLGVRRAMRWHPKGKRGAGVRAAAGAAASFGLALGVFAWAYMPNHPMDIAIASLISNAAFGLAIGLLNVQAVTGPRWRNMLRLGR